MTITPLGDSALIVRVRTPRDKDAKECGREVAQVWQRLKIADLPGVIELAPAFTSVGVFYDAAKVAVSGAPEGKTFEWLKDQIQAALSGRVSMGRVKRNRTVEIPVCYGAEFAPDLPVVATASGLKLEDVIATHAGAEYRVACVGFAPGFPYLAGLPAALTTPRRATPRTQVAAGSVAIGGTQAGIYPQQTPGGWNVIGRTPRRLFDATREPPAFLALGDTVRFRRITRSEFEEFSE